MQITEAEFMTTMFLIITPIVLALIWTKAKDYTVRKVKASLGKSITWKVVPDTTKEIDKPNMYVRVVDYQDSSAGLMRLSCLSAITYAVKFEKGVPLLCLVFRKTAVQILAEELSKKERYVQFVTIFDNDETFVVYP